VASKELDDIETEQFRLKQAKKFQKQLKGQEVLKGNQNNIRRQTRSSSRQNSKEETDSNQENIEIEQDNIIFREQTNLVLEKVQSEKKTKNQGIFEEIGETEVENPVVKLPIAVMANQNGNQNDARINAYMDLKAKLNIPIYEGEPHKLKSFLNSYEMRTAAAGSNDEARNVRLGLYTNDMVMTILNGGKEDNKCKTWKETKAFLQDALGARDTEKWERERYQNRRREEGEPISYYATDIREMGKLLKESEKSMAATFLLGLNPELRRTI